jgi:heterodisulfide reductase subunit A-like polyferredoxin
LGDALRRILRLRRRRAEGYPGKGIWGRPRPTRMAVVDPDACVGCGDCLQLCMYRRIRVRRGRAKVARGCMGCGACARGCGRGAIDLVER